MALSFTQEEVERELADVLMHGDLTEIARISGNAESTIKRQFNANDHEAASCAFRTLQVACALDDISPERGERFWKTLERLRDISKKQPRAKKLPGNAVGRLNTEVAELVQAALDGRPFSAQMKELDDVVFELHNTRQELITRHNIGKREHGLAVVK